jgi:hypothetical protein
MYKAMRELGKLQTEAQTRDEIHPLTQEEIEDPALFSQTPQSLSALCGFQQAVTAATASRAPREKNFQNRADSERAAFAFLDQLTAPPVTTKVSARGLRNCERKLLER